MTSKMHQKKHFKFSLKQIFGDKQFVRTALKLFFPAILQNIIISSIAYVDNFFLATYMPNNQGLDGKTATILATQLLYLPMIFTVAVTYACSIISSQYRGKGDYQRFKEAVWYMIIGSFIINIAFMVAYIGFPQWSVNLYAGSVNNLSSTDVDVNSFNKVNQWSALYLQYAMIAQCFYIFSYPLATANRQDSKPIIPLFGSIAAFVLNCILNPILLILVAKTEEQAIVYVAYATIASRFLDLLIVLIFILIRKKAATFIFAINGLSSEVLKRIFRFAWHVAINEIVFSIATILISLFLYKYYPSIRAAISTATLIAQFTKLIWPGTSTVVAVLVLGFLGRGEIEQAKINAKRIIALGVVVSFILASILFIVSWFINPVLNPPASTSEIDVKKANEVVELARYLEWILVVEVAFLGAYAVMNNCLRGSGRIAIAISDMIIMTSWVIMFALISQYAYNPKIPIILTFALVETSWLVKLIVAAIMFNKINWARNIINKTT